MSAFVIDVISSFAAPTITVAGEWILSKGVRQWPVALLSRLTNLGIRYVYQQQKLANGSLPKEFSRARWVKVLTGRGNELTRDNFLPLWTSPANDLEFVQILLPNPGLGPDSWLADREATMRQMDPGIRAGLLAEQVRINATYLGEIARRHDHVALRFYDLPNMYRVIATDNIAYLTLYGELEHGRNSPCIVASRPGLLYDLALRLFTTAWSRAQHAAGTA